MMATVPSVSPVFGFIDRISLLSLIADLAWIARLILWIVSYPTYYGCPISLPEQGMELSKPTKMAEQQNAQYPS
jgi:hypothetical protein